jgi:hypothetical protein
MVIERRSEHRAGLWLFLLALTVYVATAGGSLTTTDGVVAFDVAKNLVERGSVATSSNLLGSEALRGADGRYFSPFGLAQSLYDVPFYLAGTAIVRMTGLVLGKPDSIPKALVALSQTLLVALIVWQTYRLATAVVGSARLALLAALTCAFGSLLWPYALFGFGQPLACATLLAAVSAAHAGVRDRAPWRLAWAGAWIALSLMSRHEMGLAILPIGAWIAWAGTGDARARVRRLLAFAPGALAGTGMWVTYNAVRFGHPFDSGHLRDPVPGFGSPVAEGLLGLLFSPSASLFLYSPFAIVGLIGLVGLARRDRASAVLFGSIVLVFLVFYATLGNWLGGRSYGGRYLLVVLPYLGVGWAVVLSHLRGPARRAAFVLATGLGVAVQLPGVLVDYAKISQAVSASGPSFSLEQRQWAWSASPLVVNARALPDAVSDNIAYVLGRRLPPPIAAPAGEDDRSFSQQFVFSLDLWWLYLFHMGVISHGALAALCAGLAGWAVCCGLQLRAAARSLT